MSAAASKCFNLGEIFQTPIISPEPIGKCGLKALAWTTSICEPRKFHSAEHWIEGRAVCLSWQKDPSSLEQFVLSPEQMIRSPSEPCEQASIPIETKIDRELDVEVFVFDGNLWFIHFGWTESSKCLDMTFLHVATRQAGVQFPHPALRSS